MKLIQAMKKIKDLSGKAEDLRTKVGQHASDLSIETPVYQDQRAKISEWIQSHSDVLKEILHLRVAVQRTNLVTQVTIEIGGRQITKSLAEWVHRRRDLAKAELEIWSKLGDRNLKEGNIPASTAGAQATEIRIRRYFDPEERDRKKELYRTEPSIIDAALEVANAVTELIER